MIGLSTYFTKIVPVKTNKDDLLYLSSLNRLSAEVWNKCLEINEKYMNENDGKWIGRSALQKELKGYINLHAKGIQYVIHKYLYG